MLFSLSDELKNKVKEKIKIVKNEFEDLLYFEEYIIMPDYGEAVIIRFNLHKPLKLDELDAIETNLRNLIGNDFWVNLMGDAYQSYAKNIFSISDVLEYANENIIKPSLSMNKVSYLKHLKNDKDIIKKALNLSDNQKIWEIQPSNSQELYDALVLIVDKEASHDKEEIIVLGNHTLKVIFFEKDEDFCGLVKLYNNAKLQNTAIFTQILNLNKRINTK